MVDKVLNYELRSDWVGKGRRLIRRRSKDERTRKQLEVKVGEIGT